MTILRVEQAVKSFDSARALDGASFSVAAGEWVGLLGPNGAGKTTLVRSIAGRVRLDSGKVDLSVETGSGRSMAGGLGIVPQEIALYPMLTARENLQSFAALYGIGRSIARERVQWALDWTGLAERASDLAGGFSGGMQRRLNLACSVLHEPKLLLLDEPTVGVDPQSRERIWEMLTELRRGGTTLVLTTHQLDEAQIVCERIVIIDHGRVIADGTLPELIDRTIGRERRVDVRLDRAPSSGDWGDWGDFEFDTDRQTLTARTTDAAGTLAQLTQRVHDLGAEIAEVDIQAPSLQSVFLHLTGRELRE